MIYTFVNLIFSKLKRTKQIMKRLVITFIIFLLLHVAKRTLITECLNVPQAADITNAVQHYDPDSVCSDSFAVPNRKNSKLTFY